jgi:hypothetical protein
MKKEINHSAWMPKSLKKGGKARAKRNKKPPDCGRLNKGGGCYEKGLSFKKPLSRRL